MKLSDDELQERLEGWPVARLASVDGQGHPHQVPIVFAKVEGRLYSPVDGKPKAGPELARVRNLRARPAASLLLDEYDDDWACLWWIRIDAAARVVRPADPQRDPEVGLALAGLRRKYPQYDGVPILRDPPTLLVFDRLRVRSWCATHGADRRSQASEPPAPASGLGLAAPQAARLGGHGRATSRTMASWIQPS